MRGMIEAQTPGGAPASTLAARALPVLLALFCLGVAAGCAPAGDAERAARIERDLLASCSCHPKKIEGLPIESAIRESIAAGIASGRSDSEILWAVLSEHGNALLRAGIEDVALRAAAAATVSVATLLAGLGVLLLQLRRPRAPGDGAPAEPDGD